MQTQGAIKAEKKRKAALISELQTLCKTLGPLRAEHREDCVRLEARISELRQVSALTVGDRSFQPLFLLAVQLVAENCDPETLVVAVPGRPHLVLRSETEAADAARALVRAHVSAIVNGLTIAPHRHLFRHLSPCQHRTVQDAEAAAMAAEAQASAAQQADLRGRIHALAAEAEAASLQLQSLAEERAAKRRTEQTEAQKAQEEMTMFAQRNERLMNLFKG